MTNWTDGYVTDINYTNGFYQELSPLWLATAATLLGFRAPALDQPYTYAELGCGQGFNANLLAAANPGGHFWGFDFNPAQTAHGRRLAKQAGLGNIEFHETSFQHLAVSADGAWPEFDFIVLHGIHSWVSRDNQLAILEFIRRFLKPGGLVYISYNCWPGWASIAPLQRLIRSYADSHPARSDIQARKALDFIQQLREGGAAFFGVHGDIAARLDVASKADINYVAHEYLNRCWNLSDFASMAEDCAHAKLSYLGSASLVENLESLSVQASLLSMLKAEDDPVLRQTIMDFASNKGFRRDIYQKGLSPLTSQEHIEAVHRIRLSPLNIPTLNEPKPPANTPTIGEITFKTPIGSASGHRELYAPLLEYLHGGARSLGEIAAHPAMAGKSLGDLIEIALLLVNASYAHPCLEGASEAVAQHFNDAVCQAALDGHNYNFLAAPKLGSGISAGFMDLVAARVLIDAPALDEGAFVDKTWQMLDAKGRRLVKDGNMLNTKAESEAELKSIYANFRSEKSGQWRRLGILPS